MSIDRVGYLDGDQFVRQIAPPVADELSGTFEPIVTAGTALQYYRGDKTWQNLSAAVVAFTPVGTLSSTDVQAAIEELNLEKAAASHTHAIADVTGLQAALDGKQPLDSDLTTLAANITAFGHSLVDDGDAATARGTLGLGTAATQNTGTSGANVPLLNGANTWGALQTISATNFPLVVNSTNSNSIKLLFQDAGVNVGGFGASSVYGITVIDLNVGNVAFAVELNAGSPKLCVNLTPVVGARRTGWTAPSGTATRTTFDTATVTTTELAERMKALLDDLIAHGLIGA